MMWRMRCCRHNSSPRCGEPIQGDLRTCCCLRMVAKTHRAMAESHAWANSKGRWPQARVVHKEGCRVSCMMLSLMGPWSNAGLGHVHARAHVALVPMDHTCKVCATINMRTEVWVIREPLHASRVALCPPLHVPFTVQLPVDVHSAVIGPPPVLQVPLHLLPAMALLPGDGQESKLPLVGASGLPVHTVGKQGTLQHIRGPKSGRNMGRHFTTHAARAA